MSNSPQEFIVDLDNAVLGEVSRVVYDYWLLKKGEAAFPKVNALDPLEIPRKVLANFTIVEVLRPGPRFRVRLTGSRVRDGAGQNYTGRMVDELPGAEEFVERFTWCVRNHKPYCARSRLSWSANDFRHYEALVLPFGDPGGPITKLASVVEIIKTTGPSDHS